MRMLLDNDQVSDDDLRAIHNDLVSLANRVVQGHSTWVGLAVAKIGEVAGALAAVVFDQVDRFPDVFLGTPFPAARRTAEGVHSSRHPRRSDWNSSASGATTRASAGVSVATALDATTRLAHSSGVRHVDQA